MLWLVAEVGFAQQLKQSPALQDALRSAGGGRVRAWVYFADKDEATAWVLTDRAQARRERNGVVIDSFDLPVNPAYVSALARTGVRVRHESRWLNAVSVEATAEQIKRIEMIPFVQRIDRVASLREPLPTAPKEIDLRRGTSSRQETPFSMDYGPSLTQNQQIGVPALHDQGLSGAGVLIAMLDTGFNNLAHEALVDVDVMATWDFVNNDPVVADEPGQAGSGNHGTYTLSALAGYEPGDLIGPAYGATFILAKTENTDWERHVEEDDWIAGAEWADDLGADIISSSLGYSTGFTNGEPSYSWSDMDGNTTIVAIGADIAASRGILVVNSAGNGGFVSLPQNTLGSPADGDGVLAVGAVDASGIRASFSSVGPSADGQIKPDVMALGIAVVAASPVSATDYFGVGGTSLACPLVAGGAALLLEARPSASNIEIMNALRQTASLAGTPDREYGYGIVDLLAARNQILTGVGAPAARPAAELHLPHPTPFNPTTSIRYDISRRTHVTLSIFDVRGELVITLVDDEQAPGSKSIVWNARDRRGQALASGVYLCRLQAGGIQQTRKLVLLK
ncbi:MAG TPA: S8 family serine peptidase [Candidatus Krumholzibacteria bacterium]|nr:S8 family serine peptidase [Candidatus Krumholzibacteria bacterium]